MTERTRIWDVPTRVFHWLLVVSFAGAFLTSESERYRDIHVILGYILLGLIAFRLVWGFVGTRHARFRSFLFGPREIATYVMSMLKGNPKHYAGHNPAGSLAIFALLALSIASGVSGVMVYQEIGGEMIEELHELASYAMLGVVAIHVAGVLLGSVMHKENLVRSMITGYKSAPPEQGITRTYTWLGVIIILAVVAFWFGFQQTGLLQQGDVPNQSMEQHGDND